MPGRCLPQRLLPTETYAVRIWLFPWDCGDILTSMTGRDDDDYDIDFYTVGPVPPDIIESHAPQPSPREQLEVFSLFCTAADMC